MANQNTKSAHHKGFSGAKAMSSGRKDWGQKTGTRIDSGALRAKSGKNKYEGGLKEAMRNGILK
jgi:hypothetical protein